MCSALIIRVDSLQVYSAEAHTRVYAHAPYVRYSRLTQAFSIDRRHRTIQNKVCLNRQENEVTVQAAKTICSMCEFTKDLKTDEVRARAAVSGPVTGWH